MSPYIQDRLPKVEMKPIHFIVISVILCASAFGLSIISSIVYWLDFSGNVLETKPYSGVYVGLWRSCTSSHLGLVCVDTENADDWLTAVQILTTMGIVLLGIGSVLGCMFTVKDNKIMIAYAWTSIIYLASVLQLSAIIVFWSTVDSPTRHFAVGFHLTILSVLLAFFSGIFVMISQKITKTNYEKLETN